MDEDLPGRFGKYLLFRRFRGAGMSEVFLAENSEENDRPVVVKRLPERIAPQDADRIRDEARQWARIGDHPHIVPLYGTCEIDKRFCLEMAYIEGCDLGQLLLSEGRLSPPRAVRIVTQIARALHQAHTAGLLHRDVKPGNILLHSPQAAVRDDEVHAFLADFGIARREATTSRLSAANQAIGTTAYMAPERFEDAAEKPSDRRVDVYALACVLYECLTGRRAFDQPEYAMIAWAHRHGPRPVPSKACPGLEPFDDLVCAGLSIERDERPDDAAVFKDLAWAALEDWTGRTVPRPAPETRGRVKPPPRSPGVVGPGDPTYPGPPGDRPAAGGRGEGTPPAPTEDAERPGHPAAGEPTRDAGPAGAPGTDPRPDDPRTYGAPPNGAQADGPWTADPRRRPSNPVVRPLVAGAALGAVAVVAALLAGAGTLGTIVVALLGLAAGVLGALGLDRGGADGSGAPLVDTGQRGATGRDGTAVRNGVPGAAPPGGAVLPNGAVPAKGTAPSNGTAPSKNGAAPRAASPPEPPRSHRG